MDEDVLNLSIRKFLKKVGITSQREIEIAIRKAAAAGGLTGTKSLNARVTLQVDTIGLDITIDGDLTLD